MIMGKFEKGQYARCVNVSDTDLLTVGKVYKVDAVNGGYIDFELDNGSVGGMWSHRFEAWQPKVGERVRVTYGHGWDGEAVVDRITGAAIIATMKTGKYVGIEGGFSTDCLLPLVATVSATTAITIEAGKFYKTRDGRKVGPIVVAQGPGKPWPWKDSRSIYYYKETGFSCPGYADGHRDVDDLVAEWVDDQPAKASNDNAEPTKPKFKVGDRVRAIKSSFGGAVSAGDVYSVTSVTDYGIRFINKSGRKDGWNAENFELVTPVAAPTNTAIVCLIEDGQPKPSHRPHVHANEGAASKEAARLASVYKGQKFGVYVLTQTVSEEKVYAHEWQNLAIKGEKIGAIKALRELASLDLLSAKKAVEVFADKAA